MDKELGIDAWTLGLKLKSDYILQTGNVLDLNALRFAIDSGIFTSVNREIVKLSLLLSKGKVNPFIRLWP